MKKTLSGLVPLLGLACSAAPAHAADIPDPKLDAPLHVAARQSIVFAGGCFWGVQAVFQHVKGVTEAVSGYAGGEAATAQYETVSTGATGHAEAVKVTYDPAAVTPGRLLKVFFAVAHDPTEVDRQGPDTGPQYRSEIFFTTPAQEKIARDYIAQLDGAKVFKTKIATRVSPLPAFYPAEDYHQNYATLHPDNPYIMINDAPKVKALRDKLPELYTERK
jgi:peptide-methionine (S)-S-oxide reductase